MKVATHFNDFFTSNAASLVNKLPACSGQFGQSHVVEFYRNKHVTEDMFSLGNVTVGQVSKILHSMCSSKATGLDEIPAKYLKDGSSVISKLLTHIINLSITTGSIPDDLKMARIVPLYKKNSKTHVGLLPIEYRVEQLMLGHMFNIINGNAPAYLISGINMNQHRYSTRARELSCVIPRVKSSGLTSFMYQGVCHWNNLPLEIKQCPSKDTFKYQVKCLLYSRLFMQETSLYVRS